MDLTASRGKGFTSSTFVTLRTNSFSRIHFSIS